VTPARLSGNQTSAGLLVELEPRQLDAAELSQQFGLLPAVERPSRQCNNVTLVVVGRPFSSTGGGCWSKIRSKRDGLASRSRRRHSGCRRGRSLRRRGSQSSPSRSGRLGSPARRREAHATTSRTVGACPYGGIGVTDWGQWTVPRQPRRRQPRGLEVGDQNSAFRLKHSEACFSVVLWSRSPGLSLAKPSRSSTVTARNSWGGARGWRASGPDHVRSVAPAFGRHG
jgi:hypothetical protein